MMQHDKDKRRVNSGRKSRRSGIAPFLAMDATKPSGAEIAAAVARLRRLRG